ncbi:MAG: sensor histidine kinase [Candidatus Kapaibacteriota bacterium]
METFFTNLIFSNARSWCAARHLAFWLWWWFFLSWLYAVKLASENPRTLWGVNTAYILSLTETLVYLPCHLLVTYSLLYVLILGYFLQKRYVAFVVGFIATYTAAVLISMPITYYVTIPLRETFGFAPPWNSTFAAFSTAIKGGSSVLGFAIGIKLLKLWYEKQRDNQILVQKNLEAELSSLKAQIHPHFLFNTLNSVYALTLHASPDAPEAVLRLSAMLRTMLYDCAAERIPLHTELELIRNYIELERLRFGDRVDVSLAWNNADSEAFAIAPLLLLPFVENAFKHGVSASNDAAWISLETSIKSNILTFRLMNSKPEMCNEILHQEYAPSTIPSGLGLQNVRKRLDLLYPEKYTISINDESETFVVVLNVELETDSLFPSQKTTLYHHNFEERFV